MKGGGRTSAYSELVKSFERVRAYMREFYVYGFKSREEYDGKSARSYDDERRRIESWLGDHMRFVRTPEGKCVFLSIDSRSIRHNPFFRAWKAKSFTDGDITLHFLLLDILCDGRRGRTVAELVEEIDGRLAGFASPMTFDESTVRKKLKEYTEAGIVTSERQGRRVCYRRAESPDLSGLVAPLHFFSEVAPCGVIGSFVLDRMGQDCDAFTFKHHYITSAMDSDVTASLFAAMREGRAVTVTNLSRRRAEPRRVRIVPLRLFISVQSGRRHLLAYLPEGNTIQSYRVDCLSAVTLEEVTPRFAELRARLDALGGQMWGVNTKRGYSHSSRTEHVEMTVRVGEDEDFIVRRLMREGRCGRVERPDGNTYRFSADVLDAQEMIPWLRTFLCRIVSLRCSNQALMKQFREDLARMYRMYGIGEEADA